MGFSKKAPVPVEVTTEHVEGVLTDTEYEYTPIKFNSLLEAVKELNNGTTKLYYVGHGSGEYFPVEDDYTLAWVWVNKNQRFYTRDEVVNLSATPLNIHWDFIQPQWTQATMDKDGSVNFWSDICDPVTGYSDWDYKSSGVLSVSDVFYLVPENSLLNINTKGINWKTSLTKRPTEK